MQDFPITGAFGAAAGAGAAAATGYVGLVMIPAINKRIDDLESTIETIRVMASSNSRLIADLAKENNELKVQVESLRFELQGKMQHPTWSYQPQIMSEPAHRNPLPPYQGNQQHHAHYNNPGMGNFHQSVMNHATRGGYVQPQQRAPDITPTRQSPSELTEAQQLEIDALNCLDC